MRSRRGVKRLLELEHEDNESAHDDVLVERVGGGGGGSGSEKWDVLSTTSLKLDARIVIARLYVQAPQHGLSKTEFRKLLGSANIDIPKGTLDEYARKLGRGDVVFKKVKLSGAKFSLSPKEQRVVVGFVLDGNLTKRLMTGKAILEFIETKLGQKLSAATITRLMHRSGMSRQAVVKRKKTYCLDKSKMVSLYHEWLVRQKGGVLANKKPSQICSIDFTYLSHRTTNLKGYAAVGR